MEGTGRKLVDSKVLVVGGFYDYEGFSRLEFFKGVFEGSFKRLIFFHFYKGFDRNGWEESRFFPEDFNDDGYSFTALLHSVHGRAVDRVPELLDDLYVHVALRAVLA